MRPRSVRFKEYAGTIGQYRDQIDLVRWLSEHHNCMFGRGETANVWKFRSHFREGQSDVEQGHANTH